MSELLGLAFLLVSRARDNGLKDEKIVWIVEQQLSLSLTTFIFGTLASISQFTMVISFTPILLAKST